VDGGQLDAARIEILGDPTMTRTVAAWQWMILAALAVATTRVADVAAQDAVTDSPLTPTASRSKTEKVPPPLTHYMGREIAQTMHYAGAPWLVRESRQREEDCRQLLDALKLKPGQVICDLGCGNGFYTLQIAEHVAPGGKVFAVDVQPEMLHLLARRAKDAKIRNFQPVLGTLVDPHLPENTFDLVLLVDVYHEFSHPEQMLQAIRRSLKPEGRVVLAEFRLEDPEVPIKLLHKMSKDQIRKELEPNGFELDEQFDGLPWQHLMFFKRSEKANSPVR